MEIQAKLVLPIVLVTIPVSTSVPVLTKGKTIFQVPNFRIEKSRILGKTGVCQKLGIWNLVLEDRPSIEGLR